MHPEFPPVGYLTIQDFRFYSTKSLINQGLMQLTYRGSKLRSHGGHC
jgi:hypothetical protein